MLLKITLKKVLKAVLMGVLWFILLYVLPNFLLSELLREALPDSTQLYGAFALVIVFFVVASELLNGTMFRYALDVGRTVAFMAFFIHVSNGGLMEFDLKSFHVEANLTVYLSMLLTINFLGLAKTLLQAVSFLAENTEVPT